MTEKLSQTRIDELLSIEKTVQKSKTVRTAYNKFRNMKRQMIIEKAVAKGITVTDKEVHKALQS